MSISRHASRGKGLIDGTDWDSLCQTSLYKKSSALALFLPLVSSVAMAAAALSFLK